MKERIETLKQVIAFLLENEPSNQKIQELKNELHELLIKSSQ